jgi:hypothetical protein
MRISARLVTVTLYGAPLVPWPDAALAAQGSEWQFGAESAVPISVPGWLPADSLRASLSYDSAEVIAGFQADLNQDGTPDLVFRFSFTVCGTNCEYALVDGRTRQGLGTVGGTVVVVGPVLINGYPVIRAYGHSSAAAGYWSTSVFDGQGYVSVGSVYVEGLSRVRLFATLENIPFWPPPAPRR